ncbi:MAG: WG repeat-containing protein [Clostridia bacterium]|nr:WG repeat-containing protein [Clostridia bacterium]
MMKKKLRLTVLIVIVLIAIIMTVMYINKKNGGYKKEKIEENYFIINEKEKYGVIDRNGNIIINPEYDAIQIPNPSQGVFICLDEYNPETAEYNSKVLNENAEEILKQYEQVAAIEVKDMTTPYLYKTSILKYKENGKYGIIDLKGKKLTESKYDLITNLEYKDEELLVVEDSKYGVIKANGKQIISTEYSSITADKYYNNKSNYKKAGFIVSKKTDEGYRYGYMDKNGKVVLEVEYSELSRVTDAVDEKNIYIIASKNAKEGLIKNKKVVIPFEYDTIEYNYINNVYSIEKNKKVGVVNPKGKTILQIEYEDINFSGIYINAQKDGEILLFEQSGELVKDPRYISLLETEDKKYFITLDSNNLYGVMDQEWKQVIANNYDFIQYAFEDYFIVSKDAKVGVINKEGKSIVDIKYDIIEKFENGDLIKAVSTQEGYIDLYNSNMELVANMKDAYTYEEEEYIKIYSDTQAKYFSLQGIEINSSDLFSKNPLYAINQDGKWGFSDGKTTVVECKYDMVTELNEYGYAGIKLMGKWGIIDKNGKVVVEPVYELNTLEPEFIGKYYKVYYGYGQPYYTSTIEVK